MPNTLIGLRLFYVVSGCPRLGQTSVLRAGSPVSSYQGPVYVCLRSQPLGEQNLGTRSGRSRLLQARKGQLTEQVDSDQSRGVVKHVTAMGTIREPRGAIRDLGCHQRDSGCHWRALRCHQRALGAIGSQHRGDVASLPRGCVVRLDKTTECVGVDLVSRMDGWHH